MEKDFDQDSLLGFLDIEEDNREQREKLRLKDGERREVTILFADIKNSTAIGNQLDPELFHSQLDELMKRFTRCITHYGGYVDKYLGDGIMALFGAKKATEQDTERAVMAALRMISQTELFNQKLPGKPLSATKQIGIRIGINSGLVLVAKVGEGREGDFTVTGNAVNLAQRMESNAPVGRILLPAHTKEAVERYFEFEHIGPVQAKGFSTPVDAYAVLHPKHEKGSRWYRRRSMFIGRDMELGTLNQAFLHLERLKKGLDDKAEDIRIIGLTGDAGLGKSRLVHEFISGLGDRAQTCFAAASGIVKSPYNLFINLLENEFQLQLMEAPQEKKRKLEQGFGALCEGRDEEDTRELMNHYPLIGALLEIPGNDPRLKLSGQDLHTHLKLALSQTILRIVGNKTAMDKPLIMILDDLHWMDESSALVFADVIHRLFSAEDSKGNLLLILQYRQDYIPHDALKDLPYFRQLELHPFSDNEIMRLLQFHTSGQNIPEATLNTVKLLSTGNPFYLEEWCNYLEELPKHDLYDLPVPNSLHALILSRLDLLDSAIRQLLQKASVIGHEFLVDILRWIEDKLYNPADLDGTLANLEKQDFILRLLGFDYSAYFFKHIITRDVAYQTLLLENRAILHKLAAEAIEELYPDRTREFLYKLADHYHRAGVADKAMFYLEQAALAAQKAFGNSLAIELWEKLLNWKCGKVELWYGTHPGQINQTGSSDSSSLTTSRILLHLAEIKWLTGKWDESDLDLKEAFVQAVKSNSREELFDCHRLRGISAFQRGNAEQAKAEWDTCLELVTSQPPDPSTSRLLSIVHGNLGIWYQHHKHYDEALAHHRLSLEYADSILDDLRKARTHSNLGLIYLNQKDFEKAETNFQACLELAEANHYLKEQSIALGNLGYLAYKQGYLDKAMHFYEKKWLLVDKMDDKAELIKVLGNIANVHRDKEQYREALEYYQKVLALKLLLGNPKELAITYYCIAEEFHSLGRFIESISILDKALEHAGNDPKCLERIDKLRKIILDKCN